MRIQVQSERNLYIDINGTRLLPKHSRFIEDISEISQWGHTCDCCGIGCTPELLRNNPHGLWRFDRKSAIARHFDVRERKFTWISKRYPKLVEALGNYIHPDEVYWPRVGKDDNRRWWVRMVERFNRLPPN